MKIIECKHCGAETVSHNRRCTKCGRDTGYFREQIIKWTKIGICIFAVVAILAGIGMVSRNTVKDPQNVQFEINDKSGED